MILRNEGFVVGYCPSKKIALWVAYNLFEFQQEAPDRPEFKADPRVPSPLDPDAFDGSRYERGHLVPNYAMATRYGDAAQRQSFLMTNIAPQTPTLNRGIWAAIERRIAKSYADNFEEVWVVAGPIFDDQIETLPSGVEIPDAFYQVVVDELFDPRVRAYKPRALAFIVPQEVGKGHSSEEFLVSIDAVEQATGLDFYWQLDDSLEVALERARPRALWKAPHVVRSIHREATPTPQTAVSPEETAEGANVVVFVTRTGSKYHRDGCAHLKSRIPIRLHDAQKRYGPCSRCF